MNSKLRAWLNSLPPAEREEAKQKLGPMAVETAEERMMNVLREAAGLPDLDVDPNEDKVEAAVRKAAGLR